jgi:hypothetical protein
MARVSGSDKGEQAGSRRGRRRPGGGVGVGRLTSAAAVGGERWWIGVGGRRPATRSGGGLADRSRGARLARCDPFGLVGFGSGPAQTDGCDAIMRPRYGTVVGSCVAAASERG